MRGIPSLRSASRTPALQAGKSAVATVAAWIIAGSLVHGELPVFAAVAALLVVQPSLNQSLARAVERSVGVVVGVLVAFVVGLAFGDEYWIVLLSIVVAIALAWLFRLTPTTSTQVPISAMLVLSVGADTTSYAVDRIVDTIIGAAVGVIVNILIVPPVALQPARIAVFGLLDEIANRLDALAAALRTPQSSAQLGELLVLARLLRPMQDKANAALAAADESLALNPLRGRHTLELAQLGALRDRLVSLVTRTLAMTRTFHDRYVPDIVDEPALLAIAEEARRAAHDLRLLMPGVHDAPGSDPRAAEPPALTAPLRVAAPDPTHWVLIGSLLEDVRRIHEEIVAAPPA